MTPDDVIETYKNCVRNAGQRCTKENVLNALATGYLLLAEEAHHATSPGYIRAKPIVPVRPPKKQVEPIDVPHPEEQWDD